MLYPLRRMLKQIAVCNDDKTTSIEVELIDDSPWHLRASFEGPQGTPYDGGHFEVDIVIPYDYPYKPPNIKCITKVYHPNISSTSGAISLNILQNDWSPALTLHATLISLQSFLCDPNPYDPLDAEVGNQYITLRKCFEDTARNWTRMYARKPAQC